MDTDIAALSAHLQTPDPAEFARRAMNLRRLGGAALTSIERPRLLTAWGDTVEAFRDPRSAERRALDPVLAAACRLSAAGLAAGLEAVLGGVRRGAAERLAARLLRQREREAPRGDRPPALIILASNLPALAVQPLLPALLAGRAVILKTPSAEPFFAPAFVRALATREPVIGQAVAALTWKGGDAALEAPLLAGCDPVLVYGDRPAIDDLARRARALAGGRVVGQGPKASFAVVDATADLAETTTGLAWDTALFDQRGCLSLQAVYTDGDAIALASRLAVALEALVGRLPPGPFAPSAAAAVQQLRAEAELRGLFVAPLPLAAGTVIVEPEPAFRPSPGLRTLRVHPLADLEALPDLLGPWAGRLQGAALAGALADRLAPRLATLGLSRFAAPGALQSPDASWHNGGVDPLELFL